MERALLQFVSSLPWLGFITLVFLAWYYYNKARHSERMALIEKGGDLAELYTKKARFSFPWRSVGIVLIGITLGILTGFGIIMLGRQNEIILDVAPFGIIIMGVLFGAIAMLLVARMEKNG